MNTTRYIMGGAGTQTASVGFGGFPGGSPYTAATEEYDGNSWTTVNSMNTARAGPAGAGTQTAALAFGGDTPPVTGATEEYDGTTWVQLIL
jgi:hypothetical protein